MVNDQALDRGTHQFSPPLFTQRLRFVSDVVEKYHIHSVLDVGCSHGQLLHYLVMSSRREHSLRRYAGIDASRSALQVALSAAPTSLCPAELLHPCDVTFLHGDLTRGISGASVEVRQLLSGSFDCLACLEVVEHIPKALLASFLEVLFLELPRYCGARFAVITTPNRDFNWKFGKTAQLRHDDHKFEFSHAQFVKLCISIPQRFPFWHRVDISSVGNGATQCAVFRSHGCSLPRHSPSLDSWNIAEELFDGDLTDAVECSLRMDETSAAWSINGAPSTVAAKDVWVRLRCACVRFAARTCTHTSEPVVLDVDDMLMSPEVKAELNLSPAALQCALASFGSYLRGGHVASQVACSHLVGNLCCCCSRWVRDAAYLVDSALGICDKTWKNDSQSFLHVASAHPVLSLVILLANIGYCSMIEPVAVLSGHDNVYCIASTGRAL